MATPPPKPSDMLLARQARELYVQKAGEAMPDIAEAVLAKLRGLVDLAASARDMQERRDTWIAYQNARGGWVSGTQKAWRRALLPPTATTRVRLEAGNFELIGDDVVENKILASRMALALTEKLASELNDFRLRLQFLEGTPELAGYDIARPEVLCQLLLEQWTGCGLTRDGWASVQDVVLQHLVDHIIEAYHGANEFLVHRGVMPGIDLRPLMKRTSSSVIKKATDAAPSANASTGRAGADSGGGDGGSGNRGGGTGSGGGSSGGGGGGGQSGKSQQGSSAGNASASARGDAEETRMLTGTTPLARAKMRAQGVMGHLKRMLTDQVADFDMTRPNKASPALASAMSEVEAAQHAAGGDYSAGATHDAGSVEHAAVALRQRTTDLKKKAATSSEKATIEIVALMFQSILAEDRIPANVRVWFARLQMPVLRVAIGEPEFFESLQHPARKLIDRMGSCVMGFDASAITGGALEAEIKRVVQVIEQYPETGRRVFQLVYDEFQKFLSKFLTEHGGAQRVVSVAQQVEQKETLAIQYTIEMRSMLNDMPVRDEIRDFLFKIWAEVLAIAAVKNGPQHAETITLKRSAADLVWAASAKPNRNDRARVIQDLPQLLQRMRQGMTLLGLDRAVQDQHIKTISDTLADAFMSKTDAIPQARIEQMAKRLANLEDFITDEGVGDLPLDAETLELMIGIDASDLEVVAGGGSKPSDAMIAWARELQPGTWFTLDHNGKVAQVQYVWHSERKQLHLFASSDRRNYLIQAHRLASYLQAGLLVPTEEETLTVRATRDALAKLDANPERLLN